MMKTGFLAASQNRIRFRLYPTGEFSATRVREIASVGLEPYQDAYQDAGAYLGAKTTIPGRPTAGFVASRVSPLGLSKVANSHKSSKRRGRGGLTRYNKRLILNSALLLEQRYGLKQLSFLTLTLPPECASHEAGLYAEAKRQMLQWLQRRLSSCELPTQVIGCTEVQTSRLRSKGAFALHEHWLFVGRRPFKSWNLKANDIQLQWLKILSAVYQVGISENHQSAAVNIQRVKRTGGGYLAKYLSKGQQPENCTVDKCQENVYPSSWVTRSQSMLQMFKRSIAYFSGERANYWNYILQGQPEMFCRWSKHLKVPTSKGFDVWIGFIGWFSKEGMQLFHSLNAKLTAEDVLGCR